MIASLSCFMVDLNSLILRPPTEFHLTILGSQLFHVNCLAWLVFGYRHWQRVNMGFFISNLDVPVRLRKKIRKFYYVPG